MRSKLFFLSILIIFKLNLIHAQDEFAVFTGASVGFVPFKMSGTLDVGNISSTPIFRHVDTTGLLTNIIIHLGINIPFYKSENFSIGTKLNLGLGYQYSIKNLEGLSETFFFDFPEYLYYRNYKTKFDYSVLLGYKYNRNVLPYQLFLIAFDWNIGENDQIRLYGSPFSYNYYSQYTNGEIKPLVKIREFGISFISSFNRRRY